jgi:hypothetical protein
VTAEDIRKIRHGYQWLATTDPAEYLRLLAVHSRLWFLEGHLDGAFEIARAADSITAFRELANRTHWPDAMWGLLFGDYPNARAWIEAQSPEAVAAAIDDATPRGRSKAQR